MNPTPQVLNLLPSWQSLVVSPSLVDDDERQTASGLVIPGEPQGQKIYRGVVEAIGEYVWNGIEVGFVVHYVEFLVIRNFHVVQFGNIVAWESI